MLDIQYIKSWAGLLKIGEFIFLIVAFSSLANFSNKSENNGAFKFFLFVTITAWLLVMFFFTLFVTQTNERVHINWPLAMVIFSAIEVALMLIACSIVAEKARQYRRGVYEASGKEPIDTCDYFDDIGAACSNVEAAVVFGFMLIAMFLADATFYFIKYRSSGENENGIIQDDGGVGTTEYNAYPDNVQEIP